VSTHRVRVHLAIGVYRANLALFLVTMLCGCTSSDQPDYGSTQRCADSENGLGELDSNGDGELTEDDLSSGEAALWVQWDDEDGQQFGRYRSEQSRFRYLTDTGLPWWAAWFETDCGDGSHSAFVWFEAEAQDGTMNEGYWPTRSLDWDIPWMERGGGTQDVGGYVVLTGDLSGMSGHTSGLVGSFLLQDYIAGEPTGETLTIIALAFRDVLVDEVRR
jgi:hypothetical protein